MKMYGGVNGPRPYTTRDDAALDCVCRVCTRTSTSTSSTHAVQCTVHVHSSSRMQFDAVRPSADRCMNDARLPAGAQSGVLWCGVCEQLGGR